MAERIHYAGRGKTRLQEAGLRILHKDECERLGAYKNDKNNKTVKVRSDVELCAARVSSRRLPERWIKVQSSSKGNGGNDGKTSYKKGSDDGTPSPKTFFYGGIIRFNIINLNLNSSLSISFAIYSKFSLFKLETHAEAIVVLRYGFGAINHLSRKKKMTRLIKTKIVIRMRLETKKSLFW